MVTHLFLPCTCLLLQSSTLPTVHLISLSLSLSHLFINSRVKEATDYYIYHSEYILLVISHLTLTTLQFVPSSAHLSILSLFFEFLSVVFPLS
uniref:Uncharacterized protein n=1 Tax=Cannabis sativa TaxID=3483 RepID=A0A803QZ31_CANSA